MSSNLNCFISLVEGFNRSACSHNVVFNQGKIEKVFSLAFSVDPIPVVLILLLVENLTRQK